MSINAQDSQKSSSQDASNEQCLKSLSIRKRLAQMSLKNETDPKLLSAKQINGQFAEISSKDRLQLYDVIPDCLERIFDELSFADLINLAGTCTRLQNFVCSIFKAHTKHHEIFIDCNEYPRYVVRMRSNKWPYEFKGKDFAAFISHFNEVIKKLTVIDLFPVNAHSTRLQQDIEIERLITNALVKKQVPGQEPRELKFIRCGHRLMNGTSLQFDIEKVTFEKCIIGPSAFNWPHLFPNMQKLAIIDCDVTMARKSIEKSFPHLKCFDLVDSFASEHAWFDCTFSIPNVKRAIDENPNIEKLALRYWNEFAYDAKLLKYAAEHLPLLQSLHLWHLQYTEFFSEGAIEFPYVHKLTLSNDFFKPEKLSKNLASLTFHALQKFYFFGHYDAECVTFLARHQTIEKFVCHPNGQHSNYPTDFDIKTFGNILPSLRTLSINGKRITLSGLFEFIAGCDTVLFIKVQCLTFSQPIRERFAKDCMNLGWKVSYAHEDDVPKIIMKKI